MDYLFTANEWVYYSALLLCIIFGILIYSTTHRYSHDEISPYYVEYKPSARLVKIATFIMIGYVVFWAAIRNGVADTRQYILSYEALDANTRIADAFSTTNGSLDDKAPLFKAYQLVLKKLGLNWHWYLGSVAVISGICIYYGISKYSDDVALSCYIFVASLEFYWLINGIRQFLVIAMFFAAFRLIAEKRLFKFLFFVFIMYFIHTTALILIPIYFIANLKNWGSGITCCILLAMAVLLLFPSRINIWIDNAFSDYGYLEAIKDDDGANILRFVVASVVPVLAFVFREDIRKYNNPYVNVAVNISLITAALYAVANVTSGIFIGRLPMYTETFNILLLPFIIHKVAPKKYKDAIYISCVVGYFLFFHLQARGGGLYYTTDLFEGMDLGGMTL